MTPQGRATAGVPRWPHGRAHHSQVGVLAMGPAKARQREDKYLDPLEQPYHFLVPPLGRDGSEVLAPHSRVWLAADPLASSASEGGR